METRASETIAGDLRTVDQAPAGEPIRPALPAPTEAVDGSFRPVILLMSGRIAGFAASFFIPVILARVFSQAEFGTYKQLFLVYATLYGIAQIGMAESLFYFLPLTPQKAGKYIANSLLILAGSGLACFGLLWILGSSISRWMSNSQLSGLIPLIGVFLLLMLAAAGLEIVMIARKRHFWASCSYALSDLLRAALFILPVVWFRNLEGLLLGAVAFAAFRLCATLAYFRREFPGALRPDRRLLKEQLAYALPFELAVLVAVIQMNFHQYAVSYYFDAATFAIYSVGCLQIPLVDFLKTSASSVMMVRMAEAIRDDRREAVLTLWRDTTRKLLLVFFPLAGLLLVNARDIIVFLFTQRYLASVPVFQVSSVSILLSSFAVDAVLRVYAETRFLFLLYVVRLAAIAALIKWFLDSFHLQGAVLVTLLATATTTVWALAKMKTLMGAHLSRLLPWRDFAGITATAAAAALPALAVRSVLEAPTWARLSVIGFVYGATYLVLVFAVGILGREDRRAVAGWIRRWRGNLSRGRGAGPGIRRVPRAPVEGS